MTRWRGRNARDGSDGLWLLLMRHTEAQPAGCPPAQHGRRDRKAPAAVLSATGLEEAGQVGRTLAWTLDDLDLAGRPVEVTLLAHENSSVASATARALATAYEKAAGELAADHDGHRPAMLPPPSRWDRGLSAQANTEQWRQWLQAWRTRVTDEIGTARGGQAAALLVGHEPGMSRLVTHLLSQHRRIRRKPDVPGLDRGELLALYHRGKRWQPLWVLTPSLPGGSATKDIEALRVKIKSKMDTAKVFGAFLTALLTFTATQFASPPTRAPLWFWLSVRGISLSALGVAAVLYFMTLFWYDQLLMPQRFWSAPGAGRTRLWPTGRPDDGAVIVRRPPSSAVWVLYQNMVRTWRLTFMPATWTTGLGIVTFAAARIEPSGLAGWAFLIVAIVIVALAGWWGLRSRPILGVQD